MSGTRTLQFATVVARRKAFVRGISKEREQVEKGSRIVSVKGHK
jgi:hypothetical protein